MKISTNPRPPKLGIPKKPSFGIPTKPRVSTLIKQLKFNR